MTENPQPLTKDEADRMAYTVGKVAEAYALEDQRNAIKNLSDDVRYSPITDALAGVAQRLFEHAATLTAEAAAEGTKKRNRPAGIVDECPTCGMVDLGLPDEE